MSGTIANCALAIVMTGGLAFAQESAPPVPASPPVTPKVWRTSAGGSYLGVDTRNVTSDRVAMLKLKEGRGVEVTVVDDDAPAAKAGMKEHDVILGFNGQKVNNVEELRRFIRDTPPGKSVTLSVSRNGEPINVKVTLAKRNQVYIVSGTNAVHIPEIHVPPMNFDFEFPGFSVVQFSKRNGLEVEDLTPQLGEFLGVHNGEGVLVRAVEKTSPADAAGLKAGDVIVRVNGEAVTCGADWRHALRGQHASTVSFGIIRDRREQTVSMKMPERQESSGGAESWPELQEELETLQQARPGFEESTQDQADAARELDRAMRDMRRELQDGKQEQEREMRELRRQIERMQRESESSRSQFTEKQKRDMQRLKRDLELAQRESERSQREAQQELQQAQNEARQAQHEVFRALHDDGEAPVEPQKPEPPNDNPPAPPPAP
ncbi:MAG: PDZ domain-containing protein [Terriglobales bacterium]|jgi:membrane-associated protease RseP (regulator of RpoE activity)